MNRRIACFDFETGALRGTFGQILVACFLPLHEKDVVTFRLDDKKYRNRKRPDDDSKMVVAIRDYMEDCFAWVGWYSKQFDVRMINARLMLQGERPVQKRMHVDLIYYSRQIALHSSRLDSVAKSFNLPIQKTELSPSTWMAAKHSLDKEAMDYIVEHCEHDVQILPLLWDKFAPFIKNMHY